MSPSIPAPIASQYCAAESLPDPGYRPATMSTRAAAGLDDLLAPLGNRLIWMCLNRSLSEYFRGRDRGQISLRQGTDAVGYEPNKDATTPHEGNLPGPKGWQESGVSAALHCCP